MTKEVFEDRQKYLWKQIDSFKQQLTELANEAATDQAICLHKHVEEHGVFGDECLDCGRFWPGAF